MENKINERNQKVTTTNTADDNNVYIIGDNITFIQYAPPPATPPALASPSSNWSARATRLLTLTNIGLTLAMRLADLVTWVSTIPSLFN